MAQRSSRAAPDTAGQPRTYTQQEVDVLLQQQLSALRMHSPQDDRTEPRPRLTKRAKPLSELPPKFSGRRPDYREWALRFCDFALHHGFAKSLDSEGLIAVKDAKDDDALLARGLSEECIRYARDAYYAIKRASHDPEYTSICEKLSSPQEMWTALADHYTDITMGTITSIT